MTKEFFIVAALVASTALAGSAEWVPTDGAAKGFHARKNKVAVSYQYRIEFFQFPGSVEFSIAPDSSWKQRDLKTGVIQQAEVPHGKPTKTLRYKSPITVYPRNWLKYSGSNLLVCTDYRSVYAPYTTEDRKKVREKGYGHGMPWKDPRGTIDNFCGIIDVAGNEVFRFPISEHKPDTLWHPLDIIDDGKKAAVLLGKEKVEEGEDTDEVHYVGDFYEAIIWEFPNKVHRVKLKQKAPDHFWYQQFVAGEL